MPAGGKRPGAGRPRGSVDQKLQGDKDEPVEIEVKWKE
jgi:hypothetical protein